MKLAFFFKVNENRGNKQVYALFCMETCLKKTKNVIWRRHRAAKTTEPEVKRHEQRNKNIQDF